MDDCIETLNKRKKGGYGATSAKRFGKRINFTHVLAWIDANGRLPNAGMKILHSCDNPPCINPEHLREGTQAENVRDCVEKGRADWQKGTHHNQRKTHCKHGHEFTEENTRINVRGGRACRKCDLAAAMRCYWKKKVA